MTPHSIFPISLKVSIDKDETFFMYSRNRRWLEGRALMTGAFWQNIGWTIFFALLIVGIALSVLLWPNHGLTMNPSPAIWSGKAFYGLVILLFMVIGSRAWWSVYLSVVLIRKSVLLEGTILSAIIDDGDHPSMKIEYEFVTPEGRKVLDRFESELRASDYYRKQTPEGLKLAVQYLDDNHYMPL